MGKLVRAAQGYVSRKDTTEYLDTLKAMDTKVIPEDAMRDVLIVAYNKSYNTKLVADDVAKEITAVLDSIFPDSTFTAVKQRNVLWSTSDRNALDNIAQKCPYQFGSAVYMARALLSKYDSIPYHDYHTCEESPEPPSARYTYQPEQDLTEEDEMSFVLYPNPNTGDFTVAIDMGETIENAEFTVWSISGQKVHTSRLIVGSNNVMLNVAKGLYLYMVTVNGERKWTAKVSISTD